MYHQPVMLNESIAGLKIRPEGIYVDATFGGGGHSRRILEEIGENGILYAIDQDEDAAQNLPDDKRLVFIHGNFRYLQNYLDYFGIDKVDGIIADLGVSSHHFDEECRGFSFRSESKIDMRMNGKAVKDAAYVLNNYGEKELATIFRIYGEIDFAAKLARDIVANRDAMDMSSTSVVVSLAEKYIPPVRRNKLLAQVFQALRIEVNDEVNALADFLNTCTGVVAKEGRLVVISYHSLEDRLVKNVIRSGNIEGVEQHDLYGKIEGPWEPVTKKPIAASEEEINMNSKSRAAKLRIATRK
ncbi:MAG: 16S rRNA (cytosine(1402)-N(4))-methyltransferase RsmH [Bacteroidales bacterium]|nr:16S rRNA (cytosine(1402)-N(4))-methyltransferase RsmH [Bacteroidales bacterium]HOY37868.1 16S rRNA (cytosine(1402)-N(4))-methyltransferase RsmH [Bacteroidales bacterium]HQP03827.1 16S rRNA (cytosine(1402)-N(4))-methyltransferase RsmH [Bacteroidales bacterium]